MISKQDILDRAAEWLLAPEVVEKDYVISWLLVAVMRHQETRAKWVFKGGTCLKKCFFETFRFSEDLDFTLVDGADYSKDELTRVLREIASVAAELSGIQFPPEQVSLHERHNKQGQTTFEARIQYRGPLAIPTGPKIRFDLTQHERTFRPFVRQRIFHAYPDVLPGDSLVQTYSLEELFAEKLRALVERTRPRDLYDVVHVLNLRVDSINIARVRELFAEKCRAKGFEPPAPNEIARTVQGSHELQADWEHMLRHQLPQLQPVQTAIDLLQELIARIAQEPHPAVQEQERAKPISNVGSLQAPAGIHFWGLGVALEPIRFAASNRLLVQLDYGGKRRIVEPYSLRRPRTANLLLYVVEQPEGEVKALKVSEIRNVHVTDRSFIPKYPIELVPVGPLYAPPVARRGAVRARRRRR